MEVPAFVFGEALYSAVPELKEIDFKIGNLIEILQIKEANISQQSIDTYKQVKSNCNSIEELYDNQNGPVVGQYVFFLKNSILEKSLNMNINKTELFSLFDQKIQVLENAYSNLVASSQQTSNSSV